MKNSTWSKQRTKMQLLIAFVLIGVLNVIPVFGQKTRLSTSIIGPKVGYNGAQYSLSSAEGNITWSSNKPQIASINSSGTLSVKGKGVVVITASHNNHKYS